MASQQILTLFQCSMATPRFSLVRPGPHSNKNSGGTPAQSHSTDQSCCKSHLYCLACFQTGIFCSKSLSSVPVWCQAVFTRTLVDRPPLPAVTPPVIQGCSVGRLPFQLGHLAPRLTQQPVRSSRYGLHCPLWFWRYL